MSYAILPFKTYKIRKNEQRTIHSSINIESFYYIRRLTFFFFFFCNLINLNFCSLEVWYFMALILFAGYLKNAEVSIDALSIW